ncbi:hypothetical protein [Paraburkholderia sp. A3RO-2L]|uniref:hypothetical protein n=1 Tax=Paraburkholderia sp. A3RO-2L TaxID=3028376 RepID=UPI003DA93E74
MRAMLKAAQPAVAEFPDENSAEFDAGCAMALKASEAGIGPCGVFIAGYRALRGIATDVGEPRDPQKIAFRQRVERLLVELHNEDRLSEGQCAKVLDIDRISWRKIADESALERPTAAQPDERTSLDDLEAFDSWFDMAYPISGDCGRIKYRKSSVRDLMIAAWEAGHTRASTPQATVKGDEGEPTREVIEPLKEPVYIKKAMLAARNARVVLSRGEGPECAVFLVNIQLTGWSTDKARAEGYAKGFNQAAAWMQEAVLAHAAQSLAGGPELEKKDRTIAFLREQNRRIIETAEGLRKSNLERIAELERDAGRRPAKSHCQNGGDVCLAGNRDGICCPEDSCDIDDGVRAGGSDAR